MYRHNEMALQWLSPVAMLLHWDTYQLCEQSFCQRADLRMSWYSGSEGTAITIDNVGAIALFKFCQASQFVENIYEFVQHRVIRFRKKLLSLRCQIIHIGGLATTTPYTMLLHNPIPLKRSKVGTYGIIGQVEGLSQFFH